MSNQFPPRKNGRRWATYLTGGLLLAAAIGPMSLVNTGQSVAQAGATVRLEPPVVDTGVDHVFDVTVTVEGVVDLAAFEFTLEFIDTHLEFVDAEAGDFLGITGRKIVALAPVTDTGRITFGAYSEPGAPGPSGRGDLARVRFRALTEADTPLDLLAVALADSGNNPIEVGTVRGGTVYIGPPGTLTPRPPRGPLYLPRLEALRWRRPAPLWPL